MKFRFSGVQRMGKGTDRVEYLCSAIGKSPIMGDTYAGAGKRSCSMGKRKVVHKRHSWVATYDGDRTTGDVKKILSDRQSDKMYKGCAVYFYNAYIVHTWLACTI